LQKRKLLWKRTINSTIGIIIRHKNCYSCLRRIVSERDIEIVYNGFDRHNNVNADNYNHPEIQKFISVRYCTTSTKFWQRFLYIITIINFDKINNNK
jgi:hypothetical protein